VSLLTCSGYISDIDGRAVCSGAWELVPASEVATSGGYLTSSDFALVSSYIVGWFLIAFAVKLIRKMFNL